MQIRCIHCGTRYQVEEQQLARIRAARPRCKSCGEPVFDPVSAAPPADAPVTKDPADPGESLPAAFGPYRVLGRLGTGGMGTVYHGRDEELKRDVAIKVLLPGLCGDPDLRNRFLVEARALARVVHPNITQIFTAGQEADRPYFAMEFVDGFSTEQILKQRGRIPPLEALHIVRGVCEGLKAAQASGITHRDIKPGNLLVARDGSAKITDFGIAKLAREDHKLTATGTVVGTVAYMSPEQARGEDLDFRSDIYSLGATFYELVMGKPPFLGDSAVTVLMKHASESVRFPLDSVIPALPPPLTGIIRRMMAKKPEGRYLSYDHLIDDLGRLEKRLESEAVGPEPAVTGGTRPPDAAPATVPVRDRPLPPAPLESGWGFGTWLLIGFAVVAGAYFLLRNDSPPPEVASEPRAVATGTSNPPPAVVDPVQAPAAGPAPASVAPPVLVDVVSPLVELLGEGRLRVFGSLRNNEARTLESLQVHVTLFDDYNSELASQSAFTEPKVVLPGESARFSLLFHDAGNMERYELRVIEAPAPRRTPGTNR
ncbi:MAG: protein kinase [Gammaproteobacteria bacterium]|nr:protein kinase [Gammaproteobacteria bacterium]